MSSMSLSLIVNLIANTGAGANKVNQALDTIKRKANDIRQGFKEGIAPAFTGDAFDKNIDALDARVNRARSRLTGAFAQGLALFAPVKLAANFDQAFRGVQKVLNNVPKDKVEQLRKFLLDTSALLPVSAANLSELMASAIQFGIPIDEVERFTVFTAKAAVAFDMAAGVIGRVMAKLKNVYKLNQDGVEDLGNATNHLANNMAAEASEILDFTNRAASAANVFKMTAVEMAGIGSAMIAAGIQPEVAARGMNAMSNNILAGGKKVETGFKQLGISREAFMKRMKEDGAGAFLELMTAASKSKKGMEALINIVGKDFADDFGKLISNMELFQKSFGLLDDKRDGSVEEEYKALADGANEEWKLLLNKLSRAAIILGNQLLPHMLKLGETIGWAVDKFAAFSEANPELVGWIVQGTAALLAFGIASRVLGFLWAVVARQLFGFLGLFFKFTEAGKNVSIMARAVRALGWAFKNITPLRWATLIPKLAWSSFVTILRWAMFIPGVRWLAFIPRLAWAALIPVLKWTGLLTVLRWSAFVPKLSWGLLVPVLKWGVRFIPPILWASLLGELSWNLIIKPLGWDKYLNLDKLKAGLAKAREWIYGVFGTPPEELAARDKARDEKYAAEKKDREENPDDWVQTRLGWRKKTAPVENKDYAGGRRKPDTASTDTKDYAGDRRKPGTASTETKEYAGGRRTPKTAQSAKPIYDPEVAGTGGTVTQQKIDAKIKAAVIDKRPPNVHVNAPITIHEASDAGAVAAAVRGQLAAAVSGGRDGALHDGVD